MLQANAEIGAESNRQKTEVIFYVSDLDNALSDWKISEVRTKAIVDTATRGAASQTSQLLTTVDVNRAMHERVQLCEDLQTELALSRESLGVSRINHIFKVHDHTIFTEEAAAKTFDEVGQGSVERLCTGFTEDSAQSRRHDCKAASTAFLDTLDDSEKLTAHF